MPRLTFRRALPALAAALWLASSTAPSLAARASAGNTVTLNFPATEIDAVARAMAAILNRPVLVDPRVKGQLTLYSEQPMSPAQAYMAFQTALRGLGYAVVETAGLLKVLPEAEAKLQATAADPTPNRSGQNAGGDPVQTQVYRVQHENVNNLVAVLRPLISPNNTINANSGNNTLVVTDYASNQARLATLIAALDTPSATDVEVIPLKHTVASELATTVQRLTGDGGSTAVVTGTPGAGAAGGTTILADAHINALLVRAANPARLAAVRALVARLDQPGSSGTGGSSTHLVYLKHADATRLAQVLRAAFPGSSTGGNGGSGSSNSPAVGTGPSSGAAAVMASTGGTGSGSSSGASAQASAAVSAAAAPSSGGGIQADPATNSLIITAPDPLYRQLRALIDQLDSRRAQLYVESVIVEVDASTAVDVGLQWKSIFNLSSSSSITLGALVMALKTTAGTNILSTANLVTLDNEEAKIVVGQNVPFVTGSYTSTSGSSSNPFQTIERKDVGITLRLRPQIGADNTVRLAIFQESSSLSATAAAGTSNAGPTTNKRSIESTVVVDDGHFIVLGGLIEDNLSRSAFEVPGLSSLPGVGGLFRGRSHSRSKSNLVVFLRPTIMRNEGGAQQTTAERYAFMRSQQALMPPPPDAQPPEPPRLAPWPVQAPAPATPLSLPAPAASPGTPPSPG